jgi:cysteine desulfurase / selenocysteine lyase
MLDVARIRQDFPLLRKTDRGELGIYFDNAATTFKPQSVIDAVLRYYTEGSVNIHRGEYDLSYAVSEAFDEARAKVARFIHADSHEIIFTSGATASMNLVAMAYAEAVLQPGDVILTLESEHASSLLPLMRAAQKTGARIEYIPLSEGGRFDLDVYQTALHDRVKLVAVAHVSNVLGYILPIADMARLAHAVGAVIAVDGAQSVPHLATDVTGWDLDFLSFSSHKMLGPTGLGVLYGKKALLDRMDPVLLGGGSNARFDRFGELVLKGTPLKFESGTPAIEAVLGLSAAIDYLEGLGMKAIFEAEHALKVRLVTGLQSMDHLVVYNAEAPTGIVTFNVKGIPAQDVAFYLNANGIMVRSGNHCAKVLVDVIHTPDTVRASLAFYNTPAEVDRLIDVLRSITLEACIAITIA